MHYAQRNVEIYETIEDLVDDIQRKVSPDVKLENTKNLYFYFFYFLVLVWLVFFGDTFLFKRLQKIYRKLVRYFALLVQKTKLITRFRALLLAKKMQNKRQKFRSPVIRTDCVF